VKAIVVREFGEPGVLRLEEAPDPRLAGPDEILVDVKAVGVNPVEAYIRTGTYPPIPPRPYTPGSDSAGLVAEVGKNVTQFGPGDRVYTSGSLSGTYAERTLCLTAHVHRLPAPTSFSQGAALGVPYATAFHALFHRARAVPGETVLVHGASGGVGLAAVQLAATRGATVFGTAGSEEGRRLVLDQGAARALDHADPAHFDEILELTEGYGVDVIIELLANVNLGRDLAVLASRGRVVVVGSRGTVEVTPRDLMNREADIYGMRMPNVSLEELASIHAGIVAGLASGALFPVIAQELPLAEASAAHHAVIEGRHLGKIVLLP
jgi:NADPH2:quinone reductase